MRFRSLEKRGNFPTLLMGVRKSDLPTVCCSKALAGSAGIDNFVGTDQPRFLAAVISDLVAPNISDTEEGTWGATGPSSGSD